MRNEAELLVHARWYFSQAAQGTDQRKMKLLAELGLEYLRLIGEEAPLAARALTMKPSESDSSRAVARSPAGDRETAASRAFVKK
jgi:hypothetical protein